MLERAIVLPLSVDDSGSILSSNDPKAIWQSRVATAVLTNLGERVFRPDYGGEIQDALFQTDADAATAAANSVRDVFVRVLSSLELLDVYATIDQQNGTLSLTIDYTTPSQDRAQITLTTGTLTRSGDVIQEF